MDPLSKIVSAADAVKLLGTIGKKGVEATGETIAAPLADTVLPEAADDNQADSFAGMVAAGDIDKVSGWLQGAVTSALEAPAAGIGLPSGAALISAEIGSNLVLAPITGPLERAATYLEIAGLVVGLATGSHALALACIKPLAHTELENALSQCFDKLVFDGSRSIGQSLSRIFSEPQRAAHPPADTLEATPAPQPPPSPIAPDVHGQDTRCDPVCLCLAFVPKPTSSDAARGATDAERDPIVLSIGDDEFLRTLPAVLRDGGVTEVDVGAALTVRDLPEGRHFTLRLAWAAIAGRATKDDSSDDCQHPGCCPGQREPPDGPRCSCTCSVCRP